MTLILPPPDIRGIIEKLAAYVVKNGPGFEDKILEKERHNPRFSFLYPNDPYHPYYQRRLQEYRDVGPDLVDEMLAKSKELEQGKADVKRQAPIIQKPVVEAPEEPEPLEFLVEIPPISALDYDVIKLTARYVARNGRQFMLHLAQRELRNPQFDFLKPNHSLHAIFLRLIDQYSKTILPSRALLDRLEVYSNSRFEVMKRVMKRVGYMRYIREQQLCQEELAERERKAYASIDWHDFTVVETIDFGPTDKNLELPKPLNYSSIVNMSLVQRRELWNGNTTFGSGIMPANYNHQHLQQGEEEMDMDSEIIQPSPTPLVIQASTTIAASKRGVPTTNSSTVGGEDTFGGGVKIRQDYIPKAHSQNIQSQEGSELCPICGISILKSEIAEHIRIESLDPKWKEQKDRNLAKHRESNYVTSGTDVLRNLQDMTRVRSELSVMAQEEATRIVSEANKNSASQTVIWDGRTDSASVVRATREAMQKINLTQHQQHQQQQQ